MACTSSKLPGYDFCTGVFVGRSISVAIYFKNALSEPAPPRCLSPGCPIRQEATPATTTRRLAKGAASRHCRWFQPPNSSTSQQHYQVKERPVRTGRPRTTSVPSNSVRERRGSCPPQSRGNSIHNSVSTVKLCRLLVALLSAVHPLRFVCSMRHGCHLESQHHQTHWIFGWPAVAGWRWDGVVGQQSRCTQPDGNGL